MFHNYWSLTALADGSFEDVRNVYDSTLDKYISSFSRYAPNITDALNGLDWLLKFYTLLMGGFIVIILLIITFQVLADIAYVLTANFYRGSREGVGAKVNSFFEGICSKTAKDVAESGLNLSEYFKRRVGDLIITIAVLGLMITGQFIPVSLWLMKFTKSTIDVVLNQTPDVTVIASDIQNLSKKQAETYVADVMKDVRQIKNLSVSSLQDGDVINYVNKLNSAYLIVSKADKISANKADLQAAVTNLKSHQYFKKNPTSPAASTLASIEAGIK